jgi:hypothetical protein
VRILTRILKACNHEARILLKILMVHSSSEDRSVVLRILKAHRHEVRILKAHNAQSSREDPFEDPKGTGYKTKSSGMDQLEDPQWKMILK